MAGVDKTKLRDPLPAVVGALEELCDVITGGGYVSATFWGKATLNEAEAYMTGLTVTAPLHDTLTKVTGKVPGVKDAMTQASAAIKSFMDTVAKQGSAVTGDLIPAINQLNNPHADNNYPNAPATPDPFGFIPAILGLGNAAGLSMGGVQSSINTVIGYANDAVTYAYFSVLATQTLALLTASMA
jgi:hypothetical protein